MSNDDTIFLFRVTDTFDKLCEAFSGWAIVQGEAGLTFLLYTETWWLDFWEWEPEILVQVIQLIDEVTYIAAQDLKHRRYDRW